MHLILKNRYILAAFLVLVFVLIRAWFSGFDPSYFIVAGEDFYAVPADSAAIQLQKGPGYDGQFYYHYAIHPFSEHDLSGVEVDHPVYRRQRILYPLLTHLIAFGQPEWVPMALLLVNIFALLALFSVVDRLLNKMDISSIWSFSIFLLHGLWMSLGRDLTEVVAALFVGLCLLAFFERKAFLLIVSATLALFSRETTLVILGPLLLSYYFLTEIKGKGSVPFSNSTFYLKGLGMGLPLLFWLAWKVFLVNQHGAESWLSGGGNLAMPFQGIVDAFQLNLNYIIDVVEGVEFGIWLLYLIWNLYLIGLCIPALGFNLNKEFVFGLSLSWICYLIFALCLSISVYIDDWAFVRVFVGFNLLSLVLLLIKRRKLPSAFVVFSGLLVLSLWVRLFLRP